MLLSPSAHLDTFCRDNLPAMEEWPELLLDETGVEHGNRLNCGVALVDAVAASLGAERPCLLAPGGELWTYGDLRRVSNQITRVLTERYGIVAGNRVLLRGPNNPWLVACWVAVLKAGAVAVTTMPLLRAGELDKVAEIAAVDFALCDPRFVDDLQRSGQTRLPSRDLRRWQRTGQPASSGMPPEFDAVATAADDVALLAFTSGTTGRPKATMHFHRDVLAIADTFSATCSSRPRTTCSPARRRWPSPSASAASSSSRCGSARRPC